MTVRILTGDVLAMLATLPDESVHCVVTSPPYWGLRDYGVDGQIGLEPTLVEHLTVLVRVFREVRRVLRHDGTLWLNYGDCYATAPNGRSAADQRAAGTDDRTFRDKPFSTVQGLLKPKDLCMVPHRLAIALQEDGWWVRSDIVWHKPNPMPSSVKDRPTPSKEYLFLLTKSARYYYDAEAIKEKCAVEDWDDVPRGLERNKRDVWTIATEPCREAHFATMPTKLVEPCILAGTSARGVCPTCGAPWVRVAKKDFIPQEDAPNSAIRLEGQTDPASRFAGSVRGRIAVKTTGWEPSCDCGGNIAVPATVLDPFGGAGTTGMAATRLNRDAVLIELNPGYVEIARGRIGQDAGLLSDLSA